MHDKCVCFIFTCIDNKSKKIKNDFHITDNLRIAYMVNKTARMIMTTHLKAVPSLAISNIRIEQTRLMGRFFFNQIDLFYRNKVTFKCTKLSW